MTSPTLSSAPVERIKAVNHHLRVALDQVSEAVLILQNALTPGGDPVIAWGNEAAVRCTGVVAQDLFGSPLQPLISAGSWDLLLKALQQALTAGPATCDLRFLAPGSVLMRGKVMATRADSGEVLGVILTLAEIAVPAVTAPLAAAVPVPSATLPLQPPPSPQGWQEDVIETIRETARQVAHEFNNALTSIVLPVQLAIRAIPQSGDIYDSLEIAHVSAQRASDLAKDFLDCFRPRSAMRSICSPGALLGRSIRLATCAQNVTTSLELQEDLPEIEVDESQLERVIFNLIRNSMQAMPSGGRLRVSATRRDLTAQDNIALPPGSYVQISVRDWGPGIPEEHLQHLFHGRFTTKPGGNGCGLPICYQIVRDHGGEMLVRSRVNVGTEFLIYLPALPKATTSGTQDNQPAVRTPLAPTEPVPYQAIPASPAAGNVPVGLLPPLVPLVPLVHQGGLATGANAPLARIPSPVPVPAPPVVPAAATEEMGPPTLLVVDDEQGVRLAVSQIAKAMGFDVSTVGTSDEALQSYKDRLHSLKPFSSVLLDLNLRSGLNGMEVFQAIRRMDPEALVVATSGQYAEGDVERFRSLGFAGFLPKPYTLEHFDNVMRAALAS